MSFKINGIKLELIQGDIAEQKDIEAVITEAFKLPNKYVIHCLGPVYGRDKPEAKILARAYKNSLILAAENRIKSIAFPAISTGAFAYPIKEAADISLRTIKEMTAQLKKIETIRFVLYSKKDFAVYKKEVEKILKD